MENVQKYRDIKLTTTEKQRNYFVLEPNYHTTNYHTTKVFAENLLIMTMRKTQILLNSKFWV